MARAVLVPPGHFSQANYGNFSQVNYGNNAAGNSLPPFFHLFIFKGKRYMSELLTRATTGVKATMSDSGWINGAIFKEYLTDQFLPFEETPGISSFSIHHFGPYFSGFSGLG